MIRKLCAASVTALMLVAGSQSASAAAAAPGAAARPAIVTDASPGSYKVAKNERRASNRIRRNKHRRNKRKRNRSRNLGIGLGLAAGAIAIGAAAAAAREREEYRACRRIERRCARRHGWETRRWYRCVEDRDC